MTAQPISVHESPSTLTEPQAGADDHYPTLVNDDVMLCDDSEAEFMEQESAEENSTAARCCQYQRKAQRSPQIIRHISLPLSAGSTESVHLDHDYCSSSVVTVTRSPPHSSPPPHKDPSSASPERSSTDCDMSVTTPTDQPLTSKCLHTAVRAIPLCGRASPSEGFLLFANSLSQFLSWSVGRRRAAEWMRAIAVKQYVARQLKTSDVMTTKQVCNYVCFVISLSTISLSLCVDSRVV